MIKVNTSIPNLAIMVYEMDQVVPGLRPIVSTTGTIAVVTLRWIWRSRKAYDALDEICDKQIILLVNNNNAKTMDIMQNNLQNNQGYIPTSWCVKAHCQK